MQFEGIGIFFVSGNQSKEILEEKDERRGKAKGQRR
jgi:hypothetical protein